MLRNYLKIALRTLWKQKSITAINVLGLAAGMAGCLLVGLLFWDQLTHDDFHPGSDRMYRVTTEMRGSARQLAWSPSGVAPVLRDQAASAEAVTRLKETRKSMIVGDQGYSAQGLYADPSFFDVFGFDLVAGSKETALAEPQSAVLTRDLARRLFGGADPMGKTVRLNGSQTFTVRGVMNRDAYRSHLPFDALFSFGSLPSAQRAPSPPWREGGYYTYLRLKEGTEPAALAPTLRRIEKQYLPGEAKAYGVPGRFRLQAVSDIPLGTALPNDIAKGMLPATAGYFLAALALLVLLAAGFNYVNLSTARSLTRAREVGVRKTVGAHRQQVMGQFIAEGIVVSLIALGLGLLLLQGLVPAYNQLSVVQQQLNAPIDVDPGLLLYGAFVLFAMGVGVVAGLYPAWHLSKFQPARVLKSSVRSNTPGFKTMTPRKVLVVLQFAVALVVIVTAVLFTRQADHMGDMEETGLRTDNLVHVNLQDVAHGPFQQEAEKLSTVERVALANHAPLGATIPLGSVESNRKVDLGASVYYAVDYEFIETLGLSLLATENWSEAHFESGNAILINEAAARQVGFDAPQEALGHTFTVTQDSSRTVRIAGVVRNVNFSFVDAARQPLIFHYNPSQFAVALVQVTPGQEQNTLAALEERWTRFETATPFQARVYQDLVREERVAPLKDIGGILALVAGLAVLISCLGLLGIATYTVRTRVREVGIRKALGATVTSLVSLLSRDFLWLIGTAVAIGLPVAWWLNRLWLQHLSYRIELGVWPFALSAAGLLALALLAIGSQTVHAARIDPATTLRDE